MIAGPRRPARANQSPCFSVCLWPSALLTTVPPRVWQRRCRRAPSSDGGGDPAQAADPQADPAAAGRGLPGGGEYGCARSQGGGRHQRLGGQVRTSAPRPRRGGTGRRPPNPRWGLHLMVGTSVDMLPQVFIIMRILVRPVSSCGPPLRGSGKRSSDRGVISGLPRGRVTPAGARVALGLTVCGPLDLGPALRT